MMDYNDDSNNITMMDGTATIKVIGVGEQEIMLLIE